MVGRRIGNIEVTDTLGAGGMGTVYQGFDHKLERLVALKAIRSEFRLRAEAKDRFLHEARILSQLDHPNICTVYDFIEEDESDLLVLELVKGQSLRTALRSGLSESEKLGIAMQLLDVMALVHGHRVVHRDLKPENIMLTEDGDIKVLDFGLARSGVTETWEVVVGAPEARPAGALHHSEDTPARSFHTEVVGTELGAVIGTTAYMSPEQAQGHAATTASDMYSVGLILQEMFTGNPPYDPSLDREELVGRVAGAQTAPIRGLPPDLTQLIERLKSPAPGSRPSAMDAAERLRWIIDTPNRRHRKMLVASVWVSLALLSGGMTLQWLRADREARRAEAAAVRAEREANAAREVTDFLVGVFQVADPSSTLGETITAKEVLDRGAERAERELAAEPEHLARLLDVIGSVYSGLGLYDQSEPLLERALELRLELFEEPHPLILESRRHVAELNLRQGQYERVLEILSPVLSWESGHDLALAPALGVAARAHMELADFDSAEALLDEALARADSELGPNSPDTAKLLNDYAALMQETGRQAEAETPRREALAILRRALPPNDPRIATSLNNLGNFLRVKGSYDEAAEMLSEALAIREQVLGPDHPGVGITLNNLALAVRNQGDYRRAEQLFRRSIEVRERSLGPDHPRVANAYLNLSTLYRDLNELDEAERTARRALEINESTRGPDHPYTAIALTALAQVLQLRGSLDEAEAMAQRAVSIKERAYGPDHRRVASTLMVLGSVHLDKGEYRLAEEDFSRAIDLYERAAGPDHPWLVPCLTLLGAAYVEQGQVDRAEPLIRRAIAIREQADGGEHPGIVRPLLELGQILQNRGELAEATACYQRALSVARPVFGPDHNLTVEGERLYASVLGVEPL